MSQEIEVRATGTANSQDIIKWGAVCPFCKKVNSFTVLKSGSIENVSFAFGDINEGDADKCKHAIRIEGPAGTRLSDKISILFRESGS